MNYTSASIAEILHSPVPEHSYPVSILLTDSRSLLYPEQSLFFALRTATGDGHNFIEPLYTRGVRSFVVDHKPGNATSMPLASWIIVPDVLQALQQVTRHHRKQFPMPVIGITGSRGKTSVKEWI